MTQEATIALKEWVLAVPVGLLLALPGLGLGYLFAARNRLSHAWALAGSFTLSAAWLSIVAIVAFYTGASLTAVTVAYAAAIPVSLWIAWRFARRMTPGVTGWGAPGLVLGLVAGVTALWQGPWWYGTPDTYYHLAASRSLLVTGRPLVTDPFFGTASTLPDSTAGMWNTMQAVIAQILGTDVASLYRAFTGMGAATVILAFWLLARQVSKSSTAATLATVAYGGAAWVTDFRAFAYPNKLSISFALLAIALLVSIAEKPRRDTVLATAAAGFVALTVHLASGELTLLAGGGILVILALVALGRRHVDDKRMAWRAAGGVLAGLVLMVALSLPTLYPRVAALSGSSVLGEDSFIWAGDQLIEGLPLGTRMVTPGGFDFGGPWLFWATAAIGALMILALVKAAGHRTAAAIPLVLMAHAITVVPPLSTIALDFSSYMVARMVELLRFSPYVALAWSLGDLKPAFRWPARVLGMLLLVTAVVTAIPYVRFTYVQDAGEERRGNLYSMDTARELDVRRQWGFSGIQMLREEAGDSYPIVAADPETAYHLAGLVDVAIVASLDTHLPVFIDRDEAAQRKDDMERFYSLDVTPEQRLEILERWDAEYVFVWLTQPHSTDLMIVLREEPALETVIDENSIALFRVDRDALPAAE